MLINTATFVKSYDHVKNCPNTPMPEYCFIGRSNVGKSSLINMLAGQNYLAKTSATPGKTRLINLFMINSAWYLADLPGYGFAKGSQTMRGELVDIINDYLTTRTNLACTFLLIDSRHEPQAIDIDFMEWLGENNIPFVIVFTKTDKLSKTGLQKNIELYKKELLTQWESMPQFFITSSTNKTGKKEILSFIDTTNKEVASFLRTR